MEGDTFINTNNIRKRTSENDNFFMQSESLQAPKLPSEPMRHINDYDSNILQEEAYKDVNDKIFKLEYKISRTEDEIKELNKQINTAKEIYDYFLEDSLKKRKQQKEEELKQLLEVYKDASISTKISGQLTNKIKNDINNAKMNIIDGIFSLFSKLPGKLSSVFELRNSLRKLENINKNVDELMTRQYPYGEAGDKYNQLSKYIARANAIQSEISKIIK